jgi:hypothetical protein
VYIDRRERWNDPWMSLTKSLAGALRHRSCDAGPVCQTPAAFRCHVQYSFSCPAITKLSIREPRRMPLVIVDAASHVAVVGWGSNRYIDMTPFKHGKCDFEKHDSTCMDSKVLGLLKITCRSILYRVEAAAVLAALQGSLPFSSKRPEHFSKMPDLYNNF